MSDNAIVVVGHVLDGMNSALDPALLPSTQLAKGINIQIDHQLATTRPGACFLPVEGPDTWRTENFQGARFYNPARGQGAQVFADESASIVSAHAGRHYRFFPGAKSATVEDITGDNVQAESALILWHEQAENYLISGDDRSLTWIYDGVESRFSEGFVGVGTEADRALSEIPHGIRCIVYAHGRVWVVSGANRIFASDSLHGENQTSPEDLLKFIEQVYWASGQYFVPPSSMGPPVAVAILPTRDTSTGQGELMYHCVNGGVFSINGNVHPREAWSDTPMVAHFLLDTAASGPYAIDLQEGDQLFRSRVGVQTLRSARAESRLIGRPLKPISEEVGAWLDGDYVPYLRFASLVNHPQQERMLCTTGPILDGRHRYHKGVVSMNWDALDSGQAKPAWEGLWTFPGPYRYVAQMVRGMFADNERLFGFHYDGSKYSLVEYDENLKEDILEDGTRKAIQSRVITREVSGPDPYVPITLVSGGLYLRDICRSTKWSVWARTEDNACWYLWRDGNVCIPECPDGLLAQQPMNHTVELGGLPGALEQLRARRWQFLVQWEGWCRVEALRVRLGQGRDEDSFSEYALCLDCEDMPVCCELGDFDYSDPGPGPEPEEPGPTFVAPPAAVAPPPPDPPDPPDPCPEEPAAGTMLFWLKAENFDEITGDWSDASLAGNDFFRGFQPFATLLPSWSNGMPAVQFNSSRINNDVMNSGNAFRNIVGGGGTLFLAVELADSTDRLVRMFHNNDITTVQTINIPNHLRIDRGANLEWTGLLPAAAKAVFGLRVSNVDGITLRVQLNQVVYDFILDGSIDLGDINEWQFAGGLQSHTMAEAIAYGEELSDEDFDTCMRYLGCRFDIAVSPTGEPPGPSGLTAIATSPSTIDLIWNDRLQDDGFLQDIEIWRSPDGSTGWLLIDTLSKPSVPGYSDSGLASGTQYFYRIRAVNDLWQSVYSNTANATTAP